MLASARLWWKELPPLLADIALRLVFSAQVDRSVSHFCVVQGRMVEGFPLLDSAAEMAMVEGFPLL